MRLTRNRAFLLIVSIIVLGPLVLFFGLREFEHEITFRPVGFDALSYAGTPNGSEDVWIKTRDNVRINAWFVHSSVSPSTATILYFHGNAGNISNVGWLGQRLAGKGFDVLLVDYQGYGKSEGTISGENDLYADADAAYDYLINTRGVSPSRLVVYGHSLGTTATADLASRKPVGAVILESGLSSASDLATDRVSWLPRWLHFLAKNRFESARKLGQVHCPVLVAHGESDSLIPVEEGKKLYASANEPKKLILVPGVGHNVFGTAGDRYLDTLSEFIKESVK
ncbi:MAG TPA: alpha/beta hydrolase [Blastocatellia bacterium]|nr:alpha/beta hydrolase [Blastocatellia bacterium]